MTLIVKKFIQNNIRVRRILAFFYTYIYGCNRIKGRRRNYFKIADCFLRRTTVWVDGKGNKIQIKSLAVMQNCSIKIKGNYNTVVIDDHVSALNCEIIIEDNYNTVYIGRNTRISGKTHLACIEGCKITIGRGCLFSSDIVLRTGDSHSILNEKGIRINNSKNIEVKDHVWICNRVILTKGAKISRDSVVATGAIVTKEFTDSNVIIGGVPACIIKNKINWEEKRMKI